MIECIACANNNVVIDTLLANKIRKDKLKKVFCNNCNANCKDQMIEAYIYTCNICNTSYHVNKLDNPNLAVFQSV